MLGLDRIPNDEVEKRQAGQVIIESLTKIQRLCGMKAKRLHRYGAKEQMTKEAQAFLNRNGTKAAYTAPNASQSNSFS